jgi:REP element-mobilizing transposase RayT
MAVDPFMLDGRQLSVVESVIQSVCSIRGYGLSAINVRTNHAHLVVSAAAPPNPIMGAFKANGTRELRNAYLVEPDQRIWSRGGSTRYLWKPQNVERAIEYTLHGQGDDLPDF